MFCSVSGFGGGGCTRSNLAVGFANEFDDVGVVGQPIQKRRGLSPASRNRKTYAIKTFYTQSFKQIIG